MTAAVITSLVLYTEGVSMFWLHDDIEGDKTLDVTYAPNPEREARRAFDDLFEAPLETGCDACGYTGWSLSLDVDQRLAPAIRAICSLPAM